MQDKHGFTFLELILCLAAVSTISLISLPFIKPYSYDMETFVLDALYAQCEAMHQKEHRIVSKQGIEIEYNANGNVKHADSFFFKDKKLTLQLGWGRLVEK